MLKKRGIALQVIAIGVLVLSGSLAVGSLLVRGVRFDTRRETEAFGNRVIAALESYRSARGQYPKSLAELEPQFLSPVPAPTWGMRVWRYERLDDGRFQLAVDQNSGHYPCLYFISGSQWWSYDH